VGRLESLLGHVFARPELLDRALTHSSHANEAATAADKQLEDAKMIGTTSAELENLRSASADADRQVARAKSAVNQTQGPLDALRSAVK